MAPRALLGLPALPLLLTGCSTSNPTAAPGATGLPSIDAQAQDEICRKAAGRLAPGMTYSGDLVNAPQTARQTAVSAAQTGDDRSARYWRSQDPGTLVYVCTFRGPVPTASTEPRCPPDQTPVVDGIGPTRSFYVDTQQHWSQIRTPFPIPRETCLSEGG